MAWGQQSCSLEVIAGSQPPMVQAGNAATKPEGGSARTSANASKRAGFIAGQAYGARQAAASHQGRGGIVPRGGAFQPQRAGGHVESRRVGAAADSLIFTRFNSSALATTIKVEPDIERAATSGLSSHPVKG